MGLQGTWGRDTSGFRDMGVLGSKSSTASDLPGTRLGTTDEEDPLLRIQRMPTMPPRRIPKIPYAPSVEHRRRNNRPSPYTNQSPYNQQELMMPGDWKCERLGTFSETMSSFLALMLLCFLG